MKKLIQNIVLLVFVFFATSVNAQEKKIQFNQGVLRICSTMNFQITGYDGNEVIIKNLSGKRNQPLLSYKNRDNSKSKGQIYSISNESRKDGLKKLGKNYNDDDFNIYFTIIQKDGELIFQDDTSSQDTFVIMGNDSYELKIPNSLKLFWKTSPCGIESTNDITFYHTNPSSLSDFNGEVEIESTLNNMNLLDVSGPVAINSVGGNITVEFNKKKPKQLYSIYSNNGFIDLKIPEDSEITVDVEAKSIYSDLDFKVLEEKEIKDLEHTKTTMKLKLGSGNVRIKLNSDYGNVYLRKK